VISGLLSTTFQIYLSRVEEAIAVVKVPVIMPQPVRGAETILVVEDDNAVRRMTRLHRRPQKLHRTQRDFAGSCVQRKQTDQAELLYQFRWVSLELVVAGVARMHDNSASSSPVGVRPGGFFVINCPHCSTVNPDFAESCSRCGTPMPLGESETIQMVDATVIAPGSDFGPRYRIEALLGQGGMGRVYKAYDKDLDRTVAIKVVREGAIGESDALKRFKQELVLASKISHKNILRIHDMGDVGGLRFISMAYVEGQDLQHIIRDNPKMPLERILKFAQQIADALAAAHAEGVVHRDLKPQNLLVDKNDQIFVCDFGLAKSFEEGAIGMTRTGAFLGTPRYMSPEQVEGKPADGRADLYALGLILYELVIGDVPFTGESTLKVMYQRIQEKPKSPKLLRPDLPNWLVKIIMRCLERNPDDRYQNAFEILADLRGGASGSGTSRAGMSRIGSGSQSVIIQIPNFASRRWVLVVAGVVALMLLALAIPPVRHLIPGFRTGTGAGGGRIPAGPSISLAILPFRNASGDASLDWLGPSLADMLSTDVGQSASLRTISQDRLHQVLSDLRITPNAPIEPATMRRLAEFSHADTMVSGQYARFGSQIRIDATVQDLKHNRSVPIKIDAVDEKDIPGAVDRLATSIRNNLAFSSDVIKELKASSFQPSSGSAPALRDYNQGVQLLRDGKNVEAVKALQDAVQADPQFALAYSHLAEAESALGYDNDAGQASRKAVELSGELPLAEKYLIEASRASIVKDNKKAIEAYENLAKTFPDNTDVEYMLGSLYADDGDFDKARAQFARILQADPNNIKALWQIGTVEYRQGNPQEALDPLNRGLSLAVQVDNPEQKALILQALGISYRLMNKPDEAIKSIQDSMEITRKLGMKRLLANSLAELAWNQTTLGKPDAAMSSYNQALQILKETGVKKDYGDILINRGLLYQTRGDYDKALQDYKDALQIQRDAGDVNYQALCLSNIGDVYFLKDDADNALIYYQQSLQLREKLNQPVYLADTLSALGDLYTVMGDYDQALANLMNALEVSRKANDTKDAAGVSESIGKVLMYQGRLGAAVSAMQDSVAGLRSTNDKSLDLADSLNNLADTLALAGRGEESGKPLEEATSVAGGFKNESIHSDLLNTQGDIAFYRGDYQAARSAYEQAVLAAAKTKDRAKVLIPKMNLARVAIAEGRAQAAVPELRAAIQQADKLHLKYYSIRSSVDLAEALIKTKDYTHARQELESAQTSSEKLGLRLETARIHYLLGEALLLSGNASEADHQYQSARTMFEELRKETGAERVLDRSDLRTMYAETSRIPAAAK